MARWLVVVLTALLVAGCATEQPSVTQVEHFDYRWQGGGSESSWQRTDALVSLPTREDPGATLVARARLPDTELDNPAIYFDDPAGVVQARLGDAVIFSGQPWSIRPLPEGFAGQTLELELRPTGTVLLNRLLIGNQSALDEFAVEREFPQFAIGTLLLFLGIVLGLASLRRPRFLAYAWFGLFAGALGLVTVAETSLLSRMVVPSADFWRVAQSSAIFLYPLGLVRFVALVFGDTPRQVFRRVANLLLVFLLVALVLEVIDLGDIHRLKRGVYPIMLVTLVPLFGSLVRRAKSDRSARAFLVSFAVLCAIGFPDMLRGMGYAALPFTTTHYGILIFTLGLGLVIEMQFRAQRRALELYSDELAARLTEAETRAKEIETLNQELRRQIAERSRDLAKAITSAGAIVPVAAPELLPSTIFEQRYRILERLGEGGMGLVYRIERISDGRELALKVMSGTVTATAAARFAREAEIAARLNHPGLVSVVDVGVSTTNTVYFAMELVRGGSLEQRRDRFGDADWALVILRQIAEALEALHASGVVHRDLKPANVLLVDASSERPQVKLADFGIARRGAAEPDDVAPASGSAKTLPLPQGSELTRTGALMGTPLYMAPELARGAERARPTAVMFAFGVLAVELLSGEYPFSVPPLYDALAGRPMALPRREVIARIPPGLRPLIERCLAEDPALRPRAADFKPPRIQPARAHGDHWATLTAS